VGIPQPRFGRRIPGSTNCYWDAGERRTTGRCFSQTWESSYMPRAHGSVCIFGTTLNHLPAAFRWVDWSFRYRIERRSIEGSDLIVKAGSSDYKMPAPSATVSLGAAKGSFSSVSEKMVGRSAYRSRSVRFRLIVGTANGCVSRRGDTAPIRLSISAAWFRLAVRRQKIIGETAAHEDRIRYPCYIENIDLLIDVDSESGQTTPVPRALLGRCGRKRGFARKWERLLRDVSRPEVMFGTKATQLYGFRLDSGIGFSHPQR